MTIPHRILLYLSLTIFISGITLPATSTAQINFSGFIRNYNAVQTPGDHELLIGRNRLRGDLDRPLSFGEAVISNDLQHLYSSSADSFSYRLREGYLDIYLNRSDIRLGRQIITWGRADGTFITDILTPVDLSEFLTQDFADLKMGVTALSFIRYFGSDYLQLVVNPFFRPNEVPEPDERWFPRSFFNSEFPAAFQGYDRSLNLANMQIAGRYALRSNINFELDLGAMYWHFPNPSYSKSLVRTPLGNTILQLSETFTQSVILSYSGSVKLDDGVFLKSEAAFYTGRSFDYLPQELRDIDFDSPSPAEQARLAAIFDNNTDGFLTERPWLIGMAGLEVDVEGWTVSGQIIDELIFEYDDRILQDRHYWYGTLLLQRSFLRDKFTFRGFGRYNFNGKDFWVNPELSYQGIDNFEAAAGAQLFGGESPDRFYGHTSFESYARNSFAHLQVTLYF